MTRLEPSAEGTICEWDNSTVGEAAIPKKVGNKASVVASGGIRRLWYGAACSEAPILGSVDIARVAMWWGTTLFFQGILADSSRSSVLVLQG